jgi:hypothetical protein
LQVNPNAEVCKDFVNGYCARGAECNFLHVYSVTPRTTARTNHDHSRSPASQSDLADNLVEPDLFVVDIPLQEDVVDEEGSTLFLALPPRLQDENGSSGLETPRTETATGVTEVTSTMSTSSSGSTSTSAAQVGLSELRKLDSLIPNCLKRQRAST